MGLTAIVYILADTQTFEVLTTIAVIIFASPIYFLTIGKLRYVKAMHDKIITETLNFEEEIKYDQVNYIFQSVLTQPVFVSISYNDTETGEIRRFYAMGSLGEEVFSVDPFRLRELELTKFIRKRIKAVNPAYNQEEEPSRWIMPLVTMIIILLTILLGAILQNVIGM